jgi:hypothetical protein
MTRGHDAGARKRKGGSGYFHTAKIAPITA